MRPELISTRWVGDELLVLRDEQPIDRIAATAIQRVILACAPGDTPSDLAFAAIDLGDEWVVLPAASGIAGRVHFERQGFWAQRRCVYWTRASQAALPRALRGGAWPLRRVPPRYARVAASEMAACVERWPLEGPMSWDERKWARIEANRSLQPPPAAPRALKAR